MARRRLKYYTVEGTSLRYSQITEKKIKQGTIKLENLARTLAEANPIALSGLFSDARKEFTRLAKLDFVKTPEDLMTAIRTAYRSALYKVDKGRLLVENMKEIVPQIMDQEEINKMKAELNLKDINFDDWTWNEGLKRLESPDGQYWIKIDNGTKSDGYEGKMINYGTV